MSRRRLFTDMFVVLPGKSLFYEMISMVYPENHYAFPPSMIGQMGLVDGSSLQDVPKGMLTLIDNTRYL